MFATSMSDLANAVIGGAVTMLIGLLTVAFMLGRMQATINGLARRVEAMEKRWDSRDDAALERYRGTV